MQSQRAPAVAALERCVSVTDALPQRDPVVAAPEPGRA
jgi:hypothetical protein